MSTKEPPSGAWRSPLNGYTKPIMEWLFRSLVLVLCWIANDQINTSRAEAQGARKELVALSERLTRLETLRPEDSRRLQQIETTVGKIAARLGVEP